MIIREKEDTELIQNTLNGNPRAQEVLYEKYKKSVRNFLKNKYSVYYDLDDDVSEIMIKVFMNIDKYDSTKSKFRSWVFSIAKNHMVDKWRNNTSTKTLISGSSTYSSGIDFNYDNLNNLNNSGTIKIDGNSGISISNIPNFEYCSSITYISEQLSPEDYTLLDMKYVQGYNYCEIGSEFNLTSSTVSNRVNYIKTKLKKNNPEIIYE